MPSIFISYRRSDSQYAVERIYDRLAQHFGREAIFKDVDDIPGGEDFRIFLQNTLQQCKVVLAIIGPDWVNAPDDRGGRRLDNPADWVRMEIEESLSRNDVLVLPVLVSNAAMPRLDELPDRMKDLVYRNYRLARPDPDFHKDVSRLIIDLEQHVKQTTPRTPWIETAVDTSQQKLEQYRAEVRHCLEADNGVITPISRSILERLQGYFAISAEEANAVEQEELQPYKAKAEAIDSYRKVFADALQYETPPSQGTRERLQRFQNTLGLSNEEIQEIERPLLQVLEEQRLKQEKEDAERRQRTLEDERKRREEAENQRRVAEAEARRRAKAEEARRLAETRRRQKPELPPQRRQSSEPSVAPTLTRQQFLKWGGLGGLGVLTIFGINRAFSGEQRLEPEGTLEAEPDVEVSDSAPTSSDSTGSESSPVDYTRLEELLSAGEWREADQETFDLMLKIANREEQGWLDSDSLRNFPCDALGRIDQLWVDASAGQFGFSVQKKIYVEECGGPPDGQYNEAAWLCFADKAGWRVDEVWISLGEVTFDTTAPTGHLPLTAAGARGFSGLRGRGTWSGLGGSLLSCSDL